MLTDTLSPVHPFSYAGHHFFVKRDELIDPLLSGNKWRKLYQLLQTPAEQYDTLLSCGGTQSNAMLSLAALCRRKGWQFHYTSRPLSTQLRKQPEGNLKTALELGMQLHEVSHDDYESAIQALNSNPSKRALYIAQGGADPLAQQGLAGLAAEIRQWQQSMDMQRLHVVTPSGTGTTAFYLAAALPEVTVLTTACVGDRTYLESQMRRLGTLPENLCILAAEQKYHFAKPYRALLCSYRQLAAAGMEFDLIYGALMWHTLLLHIDNMNGPLLYIHSGGLHGNSTMLQRYRHKGMLSTAKQAETYPAASVRVR